jgi:hypothetical protein
MLIKIHGGTRSDAGPSLCESCRASRIIRGRAVDDEIVFCDRNPVHPARIHFKVISCSDYDDAKQPTYGELMEKAWVLAPGSRRRPAGFVKGAELHEEERLQFFRDLRKGE